MNVLDFPNEEISEMKQFYGCKVRVKDINGQYWQGILKYCGGNSIINWKLQVTLDGTPIQINSIADIELLEN
jgi:hypothetical protein